MDQYTMEVEEREPQPVLMSSFRCDVAELSEKLSQMLQAVYQLARQRGAEVCGPPFVRHSTLNESTRDFQAGIPIRQPVEGSGSVVCDSLPGGMVAVTIHRGPHLELEKARRTLNSWVRDNDFRLVGGPWEVYLSDPMLEPDMSQWETQLLQAVTK